MPVLNRNVEIMIPETVTPLPENAIPTPVKDQLPKHLEKLIGKADIDNAVHTDTPKMKQNGVRRFKLRPKVLYQQVNKMSKIIEYKTLAAPKCDLLLTANQCEVSRIHNFDSSLTSQPAVIPLAENAIPTSVKDQLPEHFEKLIGKSDVGNAVHTDTPKMKQNGVRRFKLRPRVLYEEVNKMSKIIENKKLEAPKCGSLLSANQCAAVSRVRDCDNSLINQPVSLKSRRQMYMQSRFSEKRQQRKQFELKRRAMSHDQMVFHFRDIILENILCTEF